MHMHSYMCALAVYSDAKANIKSAVYSYKVPFSHILKGLTHTEGYLCKTVNPGALLMYGHELYFMDFSPSAQWITTCLHKSYLILT